MRILAINPGSTSTKIAVYEETTPLLVRNIRHSIDELARFPTVTDQFDFRRSLVLKELEAHRIPFAFDAVIGRGGLLKPIPAGVYEVNDVMRRDVKHAMRLHACNLGCLIAYELASLLPGCRSFIADPGVVDEMDELVHITGSPLMPRITIWHALNQRAIARRFAAEQTAQHPEQPVRYEDLRLLICHLGGGISTAAHLYGRAVDVNNALDGEGPFSPERTGNLPMGDLIDLCYSGKYTGEEVKKLIYGKGGLIAHLGTNDMMEIERRIAHGDAHAELILNAMIYQVAKSIGAQSVVLYGKIDAILLTGGIAHSDYVIPRLRKRVEFLAPVYVYPGEDELEALAMNALSALRGEQKIQEYK
ncbi:MAG: butyrate kinase [Prevotellaceae bacterium]|jgi:butyrate kinase|nr:butyrate kinase [Prevotellaceae bacterium]